MTDIAVLDDAGSDLFTELTAASAALEPMWIGSTYYEVKKATDVTEGDVVLPAGWAKPAGRAVAIFDEQREPGAVVLDTPAAEILDDRHVRLYWDVDDREHRPVDRSTVFGRNENVWITR